jgi:DNA-binding transcriptional MerR regulator
MHTIKQAARLAGVSVRTLHYYDAIGLLKPSLTGPNGYRYYGEAEFLRLQQILFYRELGLDLRQIKEILSQPDFDLVSALQTHRKALEARITRISTRRSRRCIQTFRGFCSRRSHAMSMPWRENRWRASWGI